MPGQVTTDLTMISSCDATTSGGTWSAGTVDSDAKVEGTGCLYVKYTSAGAKSLTFTPTTNLDLTSTCIYFWVSWASRSMPNTKANSGLSIRLETNATSWSEWKVAGSDTLPHNGWICHIVDTDTTPDSTGTNPVTINNVDIIYLKFNLSVKGNVTWDAFRYGSTMTIIGGTSGAPATIDNLVSADTSSGYGFISLADGVYFLQGKFQLGYAGRTIASAPTGAARSSNVVTITTTTTHALTTNDTAIIAGVTDNSFNGTFTVASTPLATTFTYAQTGANATSGSGTVSVATYFKDTSKVLSFVDKNVRAAYYGIFVVGSSGADTKAYLGTKSGTAGISGCTIKSAGAAKYGITATNTYITDLGLYGCSFIDAGSISLPTNSATREVLNCNFEASSQVLADTCKVQYCNFISSDARSIRMASTSHNITDSNFVSCPQGVEINNAGSYTFNALKGTGNTWDIENSSTGTVAISATLGTTLTTYTNTGNSFEALSCQSYNANTPGFTDETTDINNVAVNDVALPPIQVTTAGDCIYFGNSTTFTGVTLNQGTAGVYSNITINWEYWNGAWVALTVTDGTSGFTLSGTKTINFTGPGNWTTTAVNVTTKYWIRARASWTSGQSITTAPLGTQGWQGSTTISNDVFLRVYVKDEAGNNLQDAQAAIYRTSDNLQLMNKDTIASGLAEATYNYTGGEGGTPIYIRVRKSASGSTRYFPVSATGTIYSSGFTLTVTLIQDGIAV